MGLLLAAPVLILVTVAIGRWQRADSDVIQLDSAQDAASEVNTNQDLDGAALPDVVLQDLNGNDVRTIDLIGTPLVVNFWYSTCPPCRREMPAFAEVDEALGGSVRFVGVNPVDNAATARSFAESVGVSYDNLLDPDGALIVAAGIAAFPTTLLVAADGTIAFQHAGAMTAKQLRSAIDEHLAP